MTAVRVHGPGDLRVEQVPVPRPTAGSGDVLLRVLAVGVCATDRKIAARGPAEGRPLVLGHEIVGEVIGGGDAGGRGSELDGERLAPGRAGRRARVVVAPNIGCGACWQCRRGSPNYCLENRALGIHRDGGMAQYVLVPERAVAAGNLLDLPDAASDVDAVLAEPLGCCIESLAACALEPGESVLVIGGGVMGRLHVLLAKALGAGAVAVVDRHPERLRQAAEVGADVCVLAGRDEQERALGSAWSAVATGEGAARHGDGFDVIVVTVGRAATVAAAQRSLATGGRLNVFGGLPSNEPDLTLDGNVLHYRNQAVLGTTGASLASLRQAIDLLAGGGVATAGLVSATLPLRDAATAFALAGSVEHGRVVLVVS